MRVRNAFLLCGAAALLGGLAAASRPARTSFVINETHSVAPGLYRRVADPPRVGLFVTVIPPPPGAAYMEGQGAPSGALLLKRVAAGAGEHVCVERAVLTWPRGAVALLARDRLGRRLPFWRGCRTLVADEWLVLGESAASFDSRYFGPVRTAAFEGVYREVWTW